MRRRSVVAASILGALGKFMPPVPAAAAPGAPAWSGLEIVDESSVFIDVTVGGKRRTALLDTGAAATVLGLTLARELKLAAVGQRTLRGYSDVGAFNELTGFTAEVDGVPVAFSRAVSADLAMISSSLGRPADLIVGHDLFLGRFVELDLPGGRWRLSPRSGGEAPSGTPLDLRFGPHFEPLITVRVENRAPAPAILDIGASAALTLSRGFADANDLLRAKRTSTAAFAGVNGVTLSTSVMMASLEIAGQTLTSMPAEVVDQWLTPEIPVIVGLAVLRRFKITFDFNGGRVWFAPSRDEVAKPFREDHSGLGVAFLTDRLVVKHVAARSPASAGGWKEGDEIVAVDGVPVSRVYADARLRTWRERSPGSSVTLTLASSAKRRIVLADYY